MNSPIGSLGMLGGSINVNAFSDKDLLFHHQVNLKYDKGNLCISSQVIDDCLYCFVVSRQQTDKNVLSSGGYQQILGRTKDTPEDYGKLK